MTVIWERRPEVPRVPNAPARKWMVRCCVCKRMFPLMSTERPDLKADWFCSPECSQEYYR